MKISTLNVNSVNARMAGLTDWLKETSPDVLLLQEIKTEFNAFPHFEFNALGYNAAVLGQKSYNGVAVLSRHKIRVISEGLPEFDDENSRYLEVEIDDGKEKYRVASIYLPNGNPPYNAPDDRSKYEYKLAWMDAFLKHAEELLLLREKVVLGGDFNVIMTDDDVYDPKLFAGNALFTPEVRRRLKSLEYQGWYDAFRTLHPRETAYTYWDYGGGAFQNDNGLRIDYLFLSPAAADCLENCFVDKSLRRGEKPSDHTALTAELK